MDFFLAFYRDGDADVVTYHKTAEEAVLACGVPRWESALPTQATLKLQPGDEINLNSFSSIIRLSGKEIDFQ